jgi:hypothetical protein
VAKVSLDGLKIEIPHSAAPEEVAQKLEEFATDLAENKFSDWGVTVARVDDTLKLSGRRNGTHFDADVSASDGVASIALSGSIELNLIKLGLAGGAQGVRGRVASTLSETLKAHLS